MAFTATLTHAQTAFDPDTGTVNQEALPPALVDVGVDEHLEGTVPLDLGLTDENGKPVKLGDFFLGGKPVLFNFAYYRCPMLCNLVLAGMVEGIRNMAWVPGKEFEVVTLSIDPKEGPEQASAKKKTHIEALGSPEAADGWHFLTGQPKAIAALTEALGFRYHYNRATDDFSHTAVVFTLSPAGKICRYLYGIRYPPTDLKLALLEAKDNQALSMGDKLLMFCYHYDPKAKGYVLFAQNFMRGSGYLVLAAMLGLLGWLWMRKGMRP
ncbi:MAG: SCO family protein [Fibrobacteria bacterium]